MQLITKHVVSDLIYASVCTVKKGKNECASLQSAVLLQSPLISMSHRHMGLFGRLWTEKQERLSL